MIFQSIPRGWFAFSALLHLIAIAGFLLVYEESEPAEIRRRTPADSASSARITELHTALKENLERRLEAKLREIEANRDTVREAAAEEIGNYDAMAEDMRTGLREEALRLCEAVLLEQGRTIQNMEDLEREIAELLDRTRSFRAETEAKLSEARKALPKSPTVP